METKDIYIKPKEIAPGVFSTGGTAQVPNTAITADSLQQPSSPINLQGTIQTPTDTGADLVSGATTGANQFQADYDKFLALNASTPETTKLEDLITGITGDLGGLTGRGAAQTQAETQTGVTQFNKELADVNAEILRKTAEYDKLNKDLEVGVRGSGNTDIRASMLFGQQAAVNRQAASEIGLLQAKQLGLQGKVEAAQKAADRAVDLMYQDREAVVNTKLKQLELIQPLLTTAEKKRSDALNYALKQEETKLVEEKQNKKDIEKMLIDAQSYQAPASVISKAQEIAKNGGSSIDVAQALGSYSMSPADKLDLKVKEATLANIYSQIEERKNPALTPTEQSKQNEVLAQEKTKVDTFTNVATLANKLLNNPKLPRAVGLSTYTTLPGTSAYDFKQTANQLINTLAAANLDKMKGAMSDKDIQFLRNIESNLSLGMSEQGFKDELNRIKRNVTNKLKEDYGVDIKMNISELSNDELINLSTQNEDNATFFNNL